MVLMEGLDAPEKMFSINFNKAMTRFCLSLNYNDHNSYLLVNEKDTFKLKADKRNFNFPTQFFLGGISNGFGATEPTEVSLKGNV